MTKIDGTVLNGVSETALFTLWCRGSEAARADSIICDPQAVHLLESIEYPYRARFGEANQIYAIRSLTFDAVVRKFLDDHPDGTIVALAEGLQTSYWRIGRPECRWVSVDLPSIIALRQDLLPEAPNVVAVEGSALDLEWVQQVRPDAPVLITAEGLLYYLHESEALGLIKDCAARFPNGTFVFDSVPRWWARRRHKAFNIRSAVTRARMGTLGYVIPPTPFGISPDEIHAFPRWLPHVGATREASPPAGRGLQGRIVQAGYGSSLVPNRWRFAVNELRFSAGSHDNA